MISSNAELSLVKPSLLNCGQGIGAWFTLKNKAYQSPDGRIAGLNLGFNTSDSPGAVEQNRSMLFSELKLDGQWVAFADQVHGSRIQLVSEGGVYASTDGLITTLPGLTLAIQVADCAAVLLWDADNKVVGAFHAGWRGAVAGIVARGIELMKRQGAHLNHLKAFVSPCIAQKNFEVGIEVAEQFPDEFVDAENYGKPHIDLKGFLRSQMTGAGLNADYIEIHGACTVDGDEKLYSHRREGKQSGRMMALIQINR